MTRKVLVIDDSAMVRRQVSTVLSQAGFEMLEAVDGIDGAEQIRANADLALVLCDINMPRLNGLDMLESLHRCPGKPERAVVAIGLRESRHLKRGSVNPLKTCC
jgi:two-component system chemotaxis response regulator CheY